MVLMDGFRHFCNNTHAVLGAVCFAFALKCYPVSSQFISSYIKDLVKKFKLCPPIIQITRGFRGAYPEQTFSGDVLKLSRKEAGLFETLFA